MLARRGRQWRSSCTTQGSRCGRWTGWRRPPQYDSGPAGKIRLDSLTRQKLLDLHGDLRRLNLNPLTVEMHVVAVVFGMSSHRRVEVIYGNRVRGHDFRRDGVASGDAFV